MDGWRKRFHSGKCCIYKGCRSSRETNREDRAYSNIRCYKKSTTEVRYKEKSWSGNLWNWSGLGISGKWPLLCKALRKNFRIKRPLLLYIDSGYVCTTLRFSIKNMRKWTDYKNTPSGWPKISEKYVHIFRYYIKVLLDIVPIYVIVKYNKLIN